MISTQVAHDIRSPLAALEMAVKQTSGLPEEERLLIRSAVRRIRDIANDLSRKKQTAAAAKPGDDSREESSVQLLSGLIDTIVSEKRLQYRDRIGVEIESDVNEDSYGLFASIQPVEFKRVISNLVNNAVESLNGNGKVSVKLLGGETIRIQVADTGQGIPPDILPKLMRRGETHGKAEGSGLGLYHARAAVEKWGGDVAIESEPGQGTTVAVTLPKAESPSWFVSELDLPENGTVVVIDDDDSIHQIWKGRLEAYVAGRGVKLAHFSSPEEFSAWHRQIRQETSLFFLCDYEFLNHRKTGLDVIRELGIAGQTVLVTSRFEEDAVRRGCEELGVKLLPKNLAGFVPINVFTPAVPPVLSPPLKGEGSAPFDAVLVDDDALVHMNWRMAAKRKNKTVRVYAGPDDFWKDAAGLPKDTPIYVDAHLADGVKGEDVSWLMGKKGFSNLHLATGYDAERFGAMPWLKSVTGKSPPWG